MRKKSTKFAPFLVSLLIICLLSTCCRQSITKNEPKTIHEETQAGLYGPYDVIRVVDGDTVIIDLDGTNTRIRILGIDTPESVAPEESGKTNTDEGTIASTRAKELLEDTKVYLEYDAEKLDQYDRTLAYVYLEDGEMFEEIMISEGLAKVVSYKPNNLYSEYFYKLQDAAKDQSKGFWETGFFK